MIFALVYTWLGIPTALGAGKDYRVVVEDRAGNVLTEGTALAAVSSGGESESTTLRDDGVNPDSKAKDGFWTASLTVSATDAVFLTVTTSTGIVTGSGSVDSTRPDLRMILSNSQLVPERGNDSGGTGVVDSKACNITSKSVKDWMVCSGMGVSWARTKVSTTMNPPRINKLPKCFLIKFINCLPSCIPF